MIHAYDNSFMDVPGKEGEEEEEVLYFNISVPTLLPPSTSPRSLCRPFSSSFRPTSSNLLYFYGSAISFEDSPMQRGGVEERVFAKEE